MAARMGDRIDLPAAPKLTPWQQMLFEAYGTLSTCRQIGMVEGPIPWTAVRLYAVDHGFVLNDLWSVIHRLDAAYLDYVAPKKGK